MKTKNNIKIISGFFALWLSFVSFGTALAVASSNPKLLSPAYLGSSIANNDNTVFDFEDEEFERVISKANTLDLTFQNNGFAQSVGTATVKQNGNTTQKVAQQNTASAYNSLNNTSARKTAEVLPVRIKIPALNKNIKVDNPKTTNISALNKGLKKAVLRYPGTGRLDEPNRNMLIFGHSSHLPTDRVFNQMYRAFNGIEKLKYDARISIIGSDGREYVYRVRKVYKASANNSSIFIDTKKKQLTLITCDNFGAKEDRWIVVADFIVKI